MIWTIRVRLENNEEETKNLEISDKYLCLLDDEYKKLFTANAVRMFNEMVNHFSAIAGDYYSVLEAYCDKMSLTSLRHELINLNNAYLLTKKM